MLLVRTKRGLGETWERGGVLVQLASSRFWHQRSAVRIQSVDFLYIEYLFTNCQLYWSDENKAKEAGIGPWKKQEREGNWWKMIGRREERERKREREGLNCEKDWERKRQRGTAFGNNFLSWFMMEGIVWKIVEPACSAHRDCSMALVKHWSLLLLLQ